MSQSLQGSCKTYRVALLPCPAGTETKTSEHRPRPALEEQDREDHTERRAEGAADEEGAEAVVPLQSNILARILILRPCDSQSPMPDCSHSPARNPYLLVQKSLAHGPVGADSSRGDGRVCVGVGHCECGVGVLSEAERIVIR